MFCEEYLARAKSYTDEIAGEGATIDLDAYGLNIASLVMSGGGKQDFGTAEVSTQLAAEMTSKKPKYAKMSMGTTAVRCAVSTLSGNVMGFFVVTTVNGQTMIGAKIVVVANQHAITVIAEVM